MTAGPTKPGPGRDGGSEPVDAPEAPVSGAEEERTAYAAEHPEAPESAGGDEAERLEGDIAELQSKADERDEYLALAQRAQADFENYRKRAAKEAAAAGARAKAGLVREVLPVLDNLERALELAGDAEGTLLDGVRLVHADLVGVLQRSGVEAFDPTGEPFDPTLHEALSTRPQDGAHPGTVLEVVEKGYRLNDTILRPARVVVSQ
jgi:molecular chaperone GrpE